jgi:hypothetical protein
MGKVLVEKLLYSCSDVKELIILIRPKRGKNEMQRVTELSKLPVSNYSNFFQIFEKLTNKKFYFQSYSAEF